MFLLASHFSHHTSKMLDSFNYRIFEDIQYTYKKVGLRSRKYQCKSGGAQSFMSQSFMSFSLLEEYKYWTHDESFAVRQSSSVLQTNFRDI